MIVKVLLGLMIMMSSSVLSMAQQGDCPDTENKKAKKTFDLAFETFRDRKLSEASKLFREVLEIDPACGKCYYYLGYINFKKEDYNLKAAENYFLKSIELCPDFDIYVYYYLADIYFGAENWKAAEENLSVFLKDKSKIENDIDLVRATNMFKYAQFYNKMYNNPVPFDPKFIKGVCSAADEYIPCISPDGETAYYTRVTQLPASKNDLIPKSTFKEKFFYSNKNGSFDNGQEMPYPFNENDNEGGATVTIDNKELYYTVCKWKGDYFNCDIYHSRKDAEGFWSDIEALPVINNPDSWESMPSISSDGKTLYFISDRKGGNGGYDIYYSEKDAQGQWKAPANMGKNVNTRGNEKTPFIHTDSKTLYYASDSDELLGLGSFDIYYTRMQPDESWSKPINIGYPINSEADDAGLIVSTDGKTGYFASNKLSGAGGWDIYAFELYNEARPEEMKIIKGTITEEESKAPSYARIEIKNVETKKITEIPVDTVTGNYALAISTRNDYIMTVKKPDHAYESKFIPAEDLSDDMQSRTIDFEVKPLVVGKPYRLNDIYFTSNSTELNYDSRIIIDGFIEFLTENPGIKVAIQGHTDNIGNDQDNLILSENRAKAVYEYIIQRNIGADRLTYKGFGETKPIAGNESETGRAKNRRTEFLIIEK